MIFHFSRTRELLYYTSHHLEISASRIPSNPTPNHIHRRDSGSFLERLWGPKLPRARIKGPTDIKQINFLSYSSTFSNFPLQDCVCLPPNKISVANERKETGDKKSKMKYFGTDPRAQICPISIPHDDQICLFRFCCLFRDHLQRGMSKALPVESLYIQTSILKKRPFKV